MKSKTTPKAFQVLRELTPGPLSSLTNPDSASRVLLPRHTSCFHLLTHNILLPVACFWLTLFPFSELFFICLVYTCYLFNKCLSTYCMVRHGSMLEILAKLYQKKNESRFNTLEAESFCRMLWQDFPRTMIFKLKQAYEVTWWSCKDADSDSVDLWWSQGIWNVQQDPRRYPSLQSKDFK